MAVIEVGQISVDEEQIKAFCEKWQIAELALFGSVLRDDFRPDSDIDVLVTFKPAVRRRYEEIWDMKQELRAVFGRDIDLAQRQVIDGDANALRRRRILASARTVYAA